MKSLERTETRPVKHNNNKHIYIAPVSVMCFLEMSHEAMKLVASKKNIYICLTYDSE